jgi:hypothetical protein
MFENSTRRARDTPRLLFANAAIASSRFEPCERGGLIDSPGAPSERCREPPRTRSRAGDRQQDEEGSNTASCYADLDFALCQMPTSLPWLGGRKSSLKVFNVPKATITINRTSSDV